eukprot:2779866-Rhodomonas_salina.4
MSAMWKTGCREPGRCDAAAEERPLLVQEHRQPVQARGREPDQRQARSLPELRHSRLTSSSALRLSRCHGHPQRPLNLFDDLSHAPTIPRSNRTFSPPSLLIPGLSFLRICFVESLPPSPSHQALSCAHLL